MDKRAYFFIDDVIWLFRDLTRRREASIYDNSFLGMMKDVHDKTGMKVQLNVFLRTDYYYGADEFWLSEMTDAYKKEWEEASDWLKFGFHARQEFPDYPHINASYDDVKKIFDETKREIVRFAGEKSMTYGVTPHWMPMSRDGVRALYDAGVRIMNVSVGDRTPYNGDPFSLPYGHAGRLQQNRKPETETYTRRSLDVAIARSLCAYNHLSEEDAERTRYTTESILDKETGMRFKAFSNSSCLNLSKLENIEKEIRESAKGEWLGAATHEQYFYSDYYAYQPDYPEKVLTMAQTIKDLGYRFVFAEELV